MIQKINQKLAHSYSSLLPCQGVSYSTKPMIRKRTVVHSSYHQKVLWPATTTLAAVSRLILATSIKSFIWESAFKFSLVKSLFFPSLRWKMNPRFSNSRQFLRIVTVSKLNLLDISPVFMPVSITLPTSSLLWLIQRYKGFFLQWKSTMRKIRRIVIESLNGLHSGGT